MPLISGGRYFRGDRYFRDLIGGQKINVTFGGAVIFGILRYVVIPNGPDKLDYIKCVVCF